MADYSKEKYFWLKLKEDFFKRHDIKIIKSMPNGKDYVILYLQLLCESLSHNGNLRFSDTIPYNEEMLSVVTDTNIDIVRAAIKLFRELGLLEVLKDQTLYMTNLNNMIGSTTKGAEKKAIQRATQNGVLVEGGQKGDICPPEIEIEQEIERDKTNCCLLKEKIIDTLRAYAHLEKFPQAYQDAILEVINIIAQSDAVEELVGLERDKMRNIIFTASQRLLENTNITDRTKYVLSIVKAEIKKV